jgi:hypothetical protein
MYAAVKTGQFYGGRYVVYGEVRGEDFANRTQNGVTGFQTYNYTVSSGTNEVNNLWNSAYAAINRINVVIAGLQTAPLSDAIKAQYTAEARFLRGLVYHSLVVLYARPFWENSGNAPGLILYTEPQTTSGAHQKPRATVAETYAQILADLNFAEQSLPLSYGNWNSNMLKWTANTDNVPVIRYAEVLLNVAEALARTGTTVDARALALVNAVRNRSDPNATVVATTQQQLIDAILLERRIELLGEGFRSMDLLRLGLPLPTKPDVNSTVGPTDPQYIWPIPNGELLVNKAAVQNPGY